MFLKLFKTNIRPEANVVVEGLQSYLGELTDVLTFPDLKWTQPDLDIMIKLPLSGHITTLNDFNYAMLYDQETGNAYYYFILNLKWKAHQTLRLQLSMDTLNTFWDELKLDALAPETRVTRRYFDRWRKDGDYLYPLVDKHPEDISAPTLFMNGSPTVVGDAVHWTLVYMTEYNQIDNLSENPTTCLAIPEHNKMLSNAGSVSRTLDSGSFPDGTCLCLDYEHTPGASVHSESGQEIFIADKAGKYCMLIVQNKPTAKGISVIMSGNSVFLPKVDVIGTSVIYRQPENFDENTAHQYWQWDDPVSFQFNSLISFSEWYESNKTDPRLIKIIELPYPPFNESVDSSGGLKIPTGWSLTAGRTLKLTDPSVGFESVVGAKELGPSRIAASEIDVTKTTDPLRYETKLWNSNYYTVKFIYDGNAHVPALENFAQPETGATNYSTLVSFSSSTGMDNSMMFSFSDRETKTTDFGNYLVCNRPTEIPYYTNEYLNYLRYGKAVDERNRFLSGSSAFVGGIGSAITTASGLAFSLKGAAIGGAAGGGIGMAIGSAIGLVSTAIAMTSSIARANDQINAKIDQYTHQSSSVSVNGDISLFRKYGKNKLLMANYVPADEIKESLARYFALHGYACDEFSKPKSWNTRYWSDYFVISPVFRYTNRMTSDYGNDVASRMQSGFRILHRHEDQSNHYDWYNTRENWETSLLS